MRRSWWGALPAVTLMSVAKPAMAAVALAGQAFPVPSSLVPLVVAAVFVLPAAVAGLLSLLRRFSHTGRGVVLAATAAAVALYARPDLLLLIRL